MPVIDLTGKRFERLIVLRCVGRKHGGALWLCQCDCGNMKEYAAHRLKEGSTVSCGCYRKDLAKKLHTKHGHCTKLARTNTYRSWEGMIRRCTSMIYKGFKNYGGRGIAVCKRWMKFENFLTDMGEKPKGLTLERVDNNKGYYPSNCKWATYIEQNNNRRNNRRRKYEPVTSKTRN